MTEKVSAINIRRALGRAIAVVFMLSCVGLLISCGGTADPVILTATPTTTPIATPTLKTAESLPATVTAIATTLPATALPATAVPEPTPSLDTGWQPLDSGLEKRVIPIYSTHQGNSTNQIETLYILRLDPAQYRLDVGYSPGEPQLLSAWQAASGAQIVLNGGFFTPEQTATSLVIDDGFAQGASYSGFGGMVGVNDSGVDIKNLSTQPYTGNEGYREALQSFPMLVLPGGQIGFPADKETGRVARRTVIGKDTDGRFLLIVTPRGAFTLHQLSKYLVESDLQLDVALNLDGGPSTGILLTNDDGTSEGYAAFTAVPLVLMFHANR